MRLFVKGPLPREVRDVGMLVDNLEVRRRRELELVSSRVVRRR